MRRWNTYQDTNHNDTLVNNNFHSNEESSDSVSPDIVMGQLWLQDDTTQVEIIELDSEDAQVISTEKQDYNFGQYWQYVDKDRFAMPEPEIYKTNRKARERRRMTQNSNYSHDTSAENFENEFAEVVNDIVYSNFYGSTNDISDNKKNRQANCFKIINKPFNSDSSSDEVEFIDRTDTSDHVNGDTPYGGEIVTFDQDIDSNKRTIWIYSFRNKRLLSDNDFELVNIPSQDSTSSTSCSLENFCEEPTVRKNTSRVASPIPATYVPRLNLSMATTLPTVTEIAEPTRNIRDEIPKSVNSPTNRHRSNNWLDEKITMNGFINHVDKQDKSSNTNVINWMSLSPRERRRRSKNTKFSPTFQSKLPVLIEVPSTEPKPNDLLSENGHTIQTIAEINTVDEETKKVETASHRKNLLLRSGKRDKIVVTDISDTNPEEGDFDKQLLQKPQITISSSRPKCAVITVPMENLDSSNWIHEDKRQVSDRSESEIQELDNSSNRDTSNICAGNKLWSRNMSLLKPVAWSEFLPITDSVPSLHLSIDSDSNKQSCFKRLAKCFRCFK